MSGAVRTPLHVHAAIYGQLKDELIASYGLAADDPAILDTLDGEADLGDVLARMIRRSRELEEQADALARSEKATKERRAAKLDFARRIRAQVQHAMDEVGMPKLERPDFLATIRRNPAGLVGTDTLDRDKLPERFVRIKREVNRTAIREAIDAGETVEGVSLGNPSRSLSIR